MTTAKKKANLALDAQSYVSAALKVGHMTRDEVADLIGASRAAVGRLVEGNVAANRDVSGLAESVIRNLYATASGVALRCQIMELKLRMADLDNMSSGSAMSLIPKAQRELEMIEKMDSERFDEVDRLAQSSLGAQIEIYSARDMTEDPEGKRTHLLRAKEILSETADAALRTVLLGEQTADADKIVSIRMSLNHYFVAWELDELHAEEMRLPRARSVAQMLSERNYIEQACKVIALIRDPRLSYQLTDATALVSQPYLGAQLLTNAMKLTGHDPMKPREWQPAWLLVPIAEDENLTDIVHILEGKK